MHTIILYNATNIRWKLKLQYVSTLFWSSSGSTYQLFLAKVDAKQAEDICPYNNIKENTISEFYTNNWCVLPEDDPRNVEICQSFKF